MKFAKYLIILFLLHSCATRQQYENFIYNEYIYKKADFLIETQGVPNDIKKINDNEYYIYESNGIYGSSYKGTGRISSWSCRQEYKIFAGYITSFNLRGSSRCFKSNYSIPKLNNKEKPQALIDAEEKLQNASNMDEKTVSKKNSNGAKKFKN